MPSRPTAVADRFYPGDPRHLRAELDAYFAQAKARGSGPALALISPHAGTIYSGPIAANAWRQLAGQQAEIHRVVLIGPAHYIAIRGIAVPSVDAFDTPLGRLRIDGEARARVLRDPAVFEDDSAHAPEHCLEVQLPFLQHTLGSDIPILPLLVGRADPADVERVLALVWEPGSIVVVSSDLSHYLTYQEARERDRATAEAITSLQADDIGEDDACGRIPAKALVELAAKRGCRIELLDLRNSGDTAGDRRRVVGYGAFAVLAASA